jgi:hypothetical protein
MIQYVVVVLLHPTAPPLPIFLGITWLKLYCRRYMFKKWNTNEEKQEVGGIERYVD